MSPVRDVKELAAILRISEVNARRKLKDGAIAHVRCGRRILIRDEDINAFLTANTVPARVVMG